MWYLLFYEKKKMYPNMGLAVFQNFPYPHLAVLMRSPRLFYLGYTVPHSIERPNQRPINVECFQAQHPSRANQPRAFTSDSIQALVTPQCLGSGSGRVVPINT